MNTQQKPRIGYLNGTTNRQVRTPRFLANAPLAWLMWKATPEASAVHRPKVGA